MSVYIPGTETDRSSMLETIGVKHLADLFSDIPEEIRLKDGLKLDGPASEFEVAKELRGLAGRNCPAASMPCFLGAGAYDRLIPAAVRHLILRSEFFTAYTPYQPEISQGTLRGIFEFQTMIASLTGMDAANASMYDGPSACAEAMIMAVRQSGRARILISETIHPEARQVMETYARFNHIEIETAPAKDGVTDLNALADLMTEDMAAVVFQSPNFYGQIEDGGAVAELAHRAKGLVISYTADALSLAVLKSPGDCGADIAVGEGQSFGVAMNYGGPWLGFMAVKSPLLRKLPGRVVGQTVDVDGRRAYVLTLQAREQHIRREKATSNICSNQGLNAMTANIYLSLLGRSGLRKAAEMSMSKARYLRDKLQACGFQIPHDGPFFDEFIVHLPGGAGAACQALLREGILGGLPLKGGKPISGCLSQDGAAAVDGDGMLICVTEKRTKEEMDRFAEILCSHFA